MITFIDDSDISEDWVLDMWCFNEVNSTIFIKSRHRIIRVLWNIYVQNIYCYTSSIKFEWEVLLYRTWLSMNAKWKVGMKPNTIDYIYTDNQMKDIVNVFKDTTYTKYIDTQCFKNI